MDILNQEEGADVIIHTRETLEVRAAFVAFRTRSVHLRGAFWTPGFEWGKAQKKTSTTGICCN
jgi:hypothetical protein